MKIIDLRDQPATVDLSSLQLGDTFVWDMHPGLFLKMYSTRQGESAFVRLSDGVTWSVSVNYKVTPIEVSATFK